MPHFYLRLDLHGKIPPHHLLILKYISFSQIGKNIMQVLRENYNPQWGKLWDQIKNKQDLCRDGGYTSSDIINNRINRRTPNGRQYWFMSLISRPYTGIMAVYYTKYLQSAPLLRDIVVCYLRSNMAAFVAGKLVMTRLETLPKRRLLQYTRSIDSPSSYTNRGEAWKYSSMVGKYYRYSMPLPGCWYFFQRNENQNTEHAANTP